VEWRTAKHVSMFASAKYDAMTDFSKTVTGKAGLRVGFWIPFLARLRHAGLSDECPLLGGRTDVELSPLAGIRAGILCRMSCRDAKRLRMAGASDRPAQAPISLSAAVSYLRAWI
jgi:hypothetical protein